MKRESVKDGSISPPPSKRRVQSTVNQKAVANFFTPASKKEPEDLQWNIVDGSLLVGKYHAPDDRSRRKIAAFDFDSTLITSASGNRFAKDAADWKWWHSSIPNTLRELYGDGYHVIIFTNQAGISLKSNPKAPNTDMKRLQDFKNKAAIVFQKLGFPLTLYAATDKDSYRKPRLGMWRRFLNDYDLERPGSMDLDRSLFVGDAGGRSSSGTARSVKDHSCCDRDFGSNIGIPFHTPEEYFLKETPRPFIREFDPRDVLSIDADDSPAYTKTNALDIVLFCGSPGAGKSTFYWKQLQPLNYTRVNQDVLKTRDRCLKAASDAIAEKTSVAVDNTNADADTRAHWIRLAEKLQVPIRCVLFKADPKLCEHNNAVRALSENHDLNPEQRTILPKMAFTGFTSRYREPKMEEGFQDITEVMFRFEGSTEQKKEWGKYWL